MTVNLFLLLGVLDARPMTPGVVPESIVPRAGSTFPGDGSEVFYDHVAERLMAMKNSTAQTSAQSLSERLKKEAAGLSPNIAAILRNEAFIGRAGSHSVAVGLDNLKNKVDDSADEIIFIQDLLVKAGKLTVGSFEPGKFDVATIEAVRIYQSDKYNEIKNGEIKFFPVDSTVNSLTLYHLIKDVAGQDDVKIALGGDLTKLLEAVDAEWNKGGAAIYQSLQRASVSPPSLTKSQAGNQETPAQDAATPPASVSLNDQLNNWDNLSEQDRNRWVQQALNMYVDDRYTGIEGKLRSWFTKKLKKVVVDGNFNEATKEILGDFLHNHKKGSLNNQTINRELAKHLYDTIVKKRVEKDKAEFDKKTQQSQSNSKVQEQLRAYERDGQTIGTELAAAIIAGLKSTTTEGIKLNNSDKADISNPVFLTALKQFQEVRMSTKGPNGEDVYYPHYGVLNPETVAKIISVANQQKEEGSNTLEPNML